MALVNVAAHAQHPLRRALDMGDAAQGFLTQHSHKTVAAVKGQHVQTLGRDAGADLARKGQKRTFHRIALDGPKATLVHKGGIVAQGCRPREPGQIACWCDPTLRGIALARHGEHPLGRFHRRHDHFITGKRAGLVGADHRDRADRLNRRQAPYDGMAARHGLHADGQRNGHHGGQAFGNGRDRDGDDGHEHFGKGHVTDEIAPEQQKPSRRKDKERQPAGEMVHLRHKRRGQFLDPSQKPPDAANLGACTGGHHQPARRALGHQRARPQHGPAVAQRGIWRDRVRRLVHRHGFTGQDRLLRGQTARLDQAQVRRNLVTRFQQHDVARHQNSPLHRLPAPIAQDRGAWGKHVADRGHGGFSLAFLQKADAGIGQHHRKDHPCIHPMLQRPGYGGGGQKHIDQHIVELGQKAAQRPPGMNLRQQVWTMTGQTGSRFGRGKPGLGHAKAFKARTDGLCMSRIG